MEKFIIFILIIFIILMLSRIRLVIIKDKQLKIKIYIFPKLGININLDRFFRKFKKATSEEKIKIIKKDFNKIYQNKKMFNDLIKIIKVRKINVVINYDYAYYPNEYIYFILWFCLSYLKNFVDKHVRCVKEELYNVDICQKSNNLFIYLDVIFPTMFLILIGIKYFKFFLKGDLKTWNIQ